MSMQRITMASKRGRDKLVELIYSKIDLKESHTHLNMNSEVKMGKKLIVRYVLPQNLGPFPLKISSFSNENFLPTKISCNPDLPCCSFLGMGLFLYLIKCYKNTYNAFRLSVI